MDDSTDITYAAQLIVFVQVINSNFNVTEIHFIWNNNQRVIHLLVSENTEMSLNKFELNTKNPYGVDYRWCSLRTGK